MNRVSRIAGLLITVGTISLVGCAPSPSPSTFGANETMRATPLQFGTVESARAVDILPGRTRLGAITGAILGGVAGSQIGRSTAANVAGATAGAAAGGTVGSGLTNSRRTRGVEISLRLDSGEMIAVVQPGDVRDFRRGDRVRVTGADENVRVSR